MRSAVAAAVLTLHAFNTGSVRAPAGFAYQGGGWFHRITMDMPAFVLEHPSAGLIVFDTGLPPQIAEDPAGYMGWFHHLLAPFQSARGQDLPSQMRRAGLDPAAVRWVIVSHRHFDHTGSLRAFPNATVVLARQEYEAAHGRVPGDRNRTPPPQETFESLPALRLIDFSSAPAYGGFEHGVDLLGDGSLVLLDASGHTAGSLAAFARTGGEGTLLAGDACWTEENWRRTARQFYAWDAERHMRRLRQIRDWKAREPGLRVLPGHDLGPLRGSGEILHE